MTNLASTLPAAAVWLGDKTALRLDGAELSYRSLDVASARVAALLRGCGVRPGDRVGVMLPNVPAFAVVYYGVLRAGGVVVPIDVLHKERELTFCLRDADVRVLFAWHATAPFVDPGARCMLVRPGAFERLLGTVRPDPEIVMRHPSDTAVILYTAGTTGMPKGAELTHANLERNAEEVVRLHGLTEDDVTLGALPLAHAFGQTCALNATVRAGACLSLVERFSGRKALEVIERDRVTVLQGVPTMHAALLRHPDRALYDTSTLRVCVSGGAPMPVETLYAFEAAFGCTIHEGYGLSETSPVAASNQHRSRRKPGSIGTPIAGVEMKVVDGDGNELPAGAVGEIVIRGHNVMKRYWRRPEATAAVLRGGWFHTGDLARVDADGYFFVVDRKTDVIMRGGHSVYPREVEEVLHEHPSVGEAAVVGLPHPVLGQEVAAVVVPKGPPGGPGGAPADAGRPVRRPEPRGDPRGGPRGVFSRPDAAELREFVRTRLAAYKYPRRVWVVPELPKAPSGKVLKRDLVLMLLGEASRQPFP